MMMAEKICFMQFYEIDITWQMTLAFDFFFRLPPPRLPLLLWLLVCRIGKEKLS
jgi:hypothetical protein